MNNLLCKVVIATISLIASMLVLPSLSIASTPPTTVEIIDQYIEDRPEFDWCSDQLSEVDYGTLGELAGDQLPVTDADGNPYFKGETKVSTLFAREPISPTVNFTRAEISNIINSFDDGLEQKADADIHFSIREEVAGDGTVFIVFIETNKITGEITETRQDVALLVTELNKAETELNKLGFSMRNWADDQFKELWAVVQDPEALERMLTNELNIIKEEVTDAIGKCVLNYIAPKECPQFKVADVIERFTTETDIKVTLDNGQLDKMEDFIYKVNQASLTACALGVVTFIDLPTYTFDGQTWIDMDLSLPGVDLSGFIKYLLDKILWLKGQLPSFSDFLSIFNIDLGAIKLDFLDIELSIHDFLSDVKLQFKAMLLELNIDVSDIDYRKYTGVDEPVKPPLELKKRKEWPGFTYGSSDMLSANAFAWAELRGSELGHAFQAYAYFGSHVLKQEIVFISGAIDARAGIETTDTTPSQVEGNVNGEDNYQEHFTKATHEYNQNFDIHLRVMGEDWIDESSDETTDEEGNKLGESFSVRMSDKNEVFRWSFFTVFMVGPIPVTVEAGFDANIGYKAKVGASPLSLYAELEPMASAEAYASAAINIIIIEVGARADLTILEISVPLGAKASLSLNDNYEPTLDVDLYANVDYTTLKGRVYAYAIYYVPRLSLPPWKKKRKEKTLFTWKGNNVSRAIFSWGMTYGPEGKIIKGNAILAGGQALDDALAVETDNQVRAELINGYYDETFTRLENFNNSMVIATDDIYATHIPMLVTIQNTAGANEALIINFVNYINNKVNQEDPEIRDSDGDGLTDAEENRIGTDINLKDTDGDGIDDYFEVTNHLDPLANDSHIDSDGDGFSDLEEYLANSPVNNANITPENNYLLYLVPILSLLLN